MELALRHINHYDYAFYYGLAFYYACKHRDRKLATHFFPEVKKDPLQHDVWVGEALPNFPGYGGYEGFSSFSIDS